MAHSKVVTLNSLVKFSSSERPIGSFMNRRLLFGLNAVTLM